MNTKGLLYTMLLGGLLFAGCVHPLDGKTASVEISPEQERLANEYMVTSFFKEAAENAIITQRTLYPHHFVTETAILNELGRKELAILSSHYKLAPGHLNVRRGEATKQLYAARTSAALLFLQESGVDINTLTLDDGYPGGDGISSENVVGILEKTGNADTSKNIATITMTEPKK